MTGRHVLRHRRRVTALAAVGTAVAAFLVATPAANATAALLLTPTFPASVSVGQTNLAGSLSFTNQSTSPDDTADVTIASMALVPACGSTTSVGNGNCPSASADPGVFSIGSATGDAGSACAGSTFTVKVTDTTTGRVAFTATPAIVLTQNATCTIDFTLSVLKMPVHPLSTSGDSATTEQFAFVSGTNSLNHSVATVASTSTAVSKAAPALTTTSTGAILIGGTVADTARLSNGSAPTGTITFALYGPNDASCAGPIAFTTSNNVSRGNASYTSAAFTPTASGTYRWVATYSGDAKNSIATEPCGSSNESVTVSQYIPSVSTQASAAVNVGASISDTATVSGGGLTPTGTITFNAYGPDDSTCAGAVAFTSTVSVTAGNGTYPSASFPTTAGGTYTWTASYSGDTNNAGATDPCGSANESVTVTKYAPSLSTQASPGITVGGSISDTATLSGGGNTPGGTITFTAYGPDDPTCANTAAFTSTISVANGNGSYQSGPFTPSTPGTYTWTAAYGGDPANTATGDGCGSTNESVTVDKISPSLSTNASAAVDLGNAITDSATLSGGGFAPTGTITFAAYGPDDPACAHASAFTSTVPVTAGNGTYPSAAFTPSAAGTYVWTASYSGDVHNAGVLPTCGDGNESVVVRFTPSLSTQASGSVGVGGSISDTATLAAGGETPTGTITFKVYGPDDLTCAHDPASTSVVAVMAGNASYPSAAFTANAIGSYTWTAAYSGDANNAPATDSCGGDNETVTVTRATPTLTTHASAGVAIGGSISDAATLSGGALTPTGTITFTAYGPGDPTCVGASAFTATIPVSTGNGTYNSGSFSPGAAGTYTWTASYTGDTANTGALDGCGGANESVTVTRATATITTQASVSGPGAISDAATVSGGLNPTGTVTFTAFGPNNANCSGQPAYAQTVPLGGNGQEGSGQFDPAQPGTYVWVATYNGDDNNAPASEPCGTTAETVSLPIVITTVTLPSAPVDAAYKQTLTVAGGKKTYHWAVTAGALPAGLKLSGAGVLSGKPTATGNDNFTVSVTDSSKPALSTQRSLTLSVTPMSVATQSLPGGTVGKAYTAKLTTSGGQSTFHWSVTSGTLPPGLKLSGAGVLSGKPTTAGSYTFTVQVLDSAKPTPHSASQTFTITVT